MDQTRDPGSILQVDGGLTQAVLVAEGLYVNQFVNAKEGVLTTCWSCFAFCWRATSQASSTSLFSSVPPESGSSHVAPHAAASAEGNDKVGLEGDHPADSAVSGAVSKVPNPSKSSAGGIEIGGTNGELWGSTGECGRESGVLIRGGGLAASLTGVTVVDAGDGDLNSRKPCDVEVSRGGSASKGGSCSAESAFKEILSKVEGGGFHAEVDISLFQREASDTSGSFHCVAGFIDQDGVDKSSSLSPCKTETEGADQLGEKAIFGRLDFDGSSHAFVQGSSIMLFPGVCAMKCQSTYCLPV
jgi:hypothetical protein